MKNGLSIIIPLSNNETNLEPAIDRISQVLTKEGLRHELILIDDNSSDSTVKISLRLSDKYPIELYQKSYKPGKVQSIKEGIARAKFDFVCIYDIDLLYRPEEILKMLELIRNRRDIVIAYKSESSSFNDNFKLISRTSNSGLQLFKKEVTDRIAFNPNSETPLSEFLIRAEDAGYKYSFHQVDSSASQHLLTVKRNIMDFFNLLKNTYLISHMRHSAIPLHENETIEVGHGFHFKGQKYIDHSSLPHSKKAFHRLFGRQSMYFISIFCIFLLGLVINWHFTFVILIAVLTFLYFTDLLFNLYLIYRSYKSTPEIKISQEEINSLQDNNLPIYTIFCPLYHEWKVIPQFIKAIDQLDYPKDKLQILLLLEEDDQASIEHIRAMALPKYYQPVVIPDSLPKTKPKALNYGLKKAVGEYVVIFDAEDFPERTQLKKALIAFRKTGTKTVCIQAKLNFYNPHQNLLTRMFTAEYSLWFDLVLTGLQSINAPIPLGGTSNHFRTSDLHMIKGWDSFNVTEDADLGIRLVKEGYTTAVMDSITLEEANSSLSNWFWQRTRWIKGYMQTYLLHMRFPREFFRPGNGIHILTFQLIIGGKVLSILINPVMWILTVSYFLFRSNIGTFIEAFFPTPVLYMGIVSLIFGNFLYMYYYMLGCAKHGHDSLLKYVFLVPFYWLAMSAAATVAFYQLIFDPHYWSKTKHGLHLLDHNSLDLINRSLTGTR